ncbi:hypothetical protein AGMMS49949_04670 [Alphaproteobacteria bacterium]|nr:hypothetical protein AGMMS49949_04670 [Alphaproteobacteria bacterium]GHS95965.1 hypothetical protein AGMMS50296_1570 [Alphaproteobacteria bacterium]
MDLEKWAAPLVDGAGRSLKYEPLYDQIRDARSEEDSSLSRGVWERELKKANWPEVFALCIQALENETKDLQIASWLCEALCHLENWEGLVRSFDFMNAFCTQCWDICYPQRKDVSEDLEHRLRILDWLLEKILSVSLFFPITLPSGIIQNTLTLAAWREAVNLDLLSRRSGGESERLAQMENEKVMTLKRCRTLARQAPLNALEKVLNCLRDIKEKAKTFEALLHEKCQGQEPPFTKFFEQMTEIEKICDFSLEGRTVAAPPPQPEAASTLDESFIPEAASEEKQNSSTAPTETKDLENSEAQPDGVTINNKKDAYEAITALADFLLEVDPQSPSPYLIKMVSSWGDKALPDILEDIATGASEGHRVLKMIAECAKGK